MAGEGLSFVGGYENTVSLKHDLEIFFGRPVTLIILTGSKQVF